ncbi:5-formyltetrahydrofolate cyclo-ligase [Magnetofaba australis]|uniref:5-formyltetrahydrofolate cyclo-ligase n=1 Tax=Magnetofaba australis TaxID=1472297 RepID=UPI000A19D464|nr:5-formyltetrahydrofolate cyclo-ligase [Magnetofaba australis]
MEQARAKQRLRATLRQSRLALSAEQREAGSRAIAAHARALPAYASARSVALYCAIHGEVDLLSLIAENDDPARRFYLPWVQADGQSLAFAPFACGDALRAGAFGVSEPVERANSLSGAALTQFDVLFLPLLGFDAFGGRLGYGGGYYDRALSHIVRRDQGGPLVIGVAFERQRVERLPLEPHDIRLDGVVTESGIHWASPASIPHTY